MRLLESYSRSCSVDIKHKPEILEKFFPLPGIEKYITLQTASGMPAKNYSLFQDVIDVLSPILQSQNIHIILLGDNQTPPLSGVYNLCGQCSIHQSYYILGNSLLHLGVDSWLAHAAGAKNIPLITLFGSTSVKNHSSYFHDKDKTIFLESHRNGNFPTYSREENPKTIDLIKPNEVIESVLKLLNINIDKLPNFIHFNANYLQKIIEIIPDGNVTNCQQFGTDSIIVRFDYLNKIDGLIKQLRVCKCSLVTNQTIDINLLKQFKPNIKELIYFIDQESNPEFIKEVRKLGIPFFILYSGPESEILDKKLDYCEYGIIHCKNNPKSKDDIKELNDYPVDKLYYKSNKLTLSKQKLYPSKAAADLDLPCNGFGGIYSAIDTPEFWTESEHFYFLS